MMEKGKTFLGHLDDLFANLQSNLKKIVAGGIATCIVSSVIFWVWATPQVKANSENDKKQDTIIIRHERMLNQQFLAPILQQQQVEAIKKSFDDFVKRYDEDKEAQKKTNEQTQKHIDVIYDITIKSYEDRTGKKYKPVWED